jgi:cystathionine beta-lyase/cystathionine gamma-synthase
MSSKERLETQFTTVAHDSYDNRHHGAINIPMYQNSLFAFDRYEEFDHAMVFKENKVLD